MFSETKGLRSAADQQALDMATSLAIAKDSADAATDSNRLARELFVFENRPWIEIEIFPCGELRVTPDGMGLTITVIATNTGRSPAFNLAAFPNFKLEFLVNTDTHALYNLRKSIVDLAKVPPLGFGSDNVLFPGGKMKWNFYASDNRPDEFDRTENSLARRFPAQAVVIIGIGYSISGAEERSGTALVRRISGESTRLPDKTFPVNFTVPINEIRVDRDGDVGDFAD